jgi:hypothetical protein
MSDLTEFEQNFVSAANDGEIPIPNIDTLDTSPSAMGTWGAERTVRAHVIRDLVLGRLGKPVEPIGLRAVGIRIEGVLDLDYVSSEIP